MRVDSTSAVVDDPRSAERALWEGVRELLQPLSEVAERRFSRRAA